MACMFFVCWLVCFEFAESIFYRVGGSHKDFSVVQRYDFTYFSRGHTVGITGCLNA